jgi:hypothetical protein
VLLLRFSKAFLLQTSHPEESGRRKVGEYRREIYGNGAKFRPVNFDSDLADAGEELVVACG